MSQPYPAPRVLDWTNSDDELARVGAILAVINPGREPSDGYIRFLTQRSFDEGLTSYVGTGGWYVTVFNTGVPIVIDGVMHEVWKPHITIMPYSIAKHLGIK